jgi:hypothetical protein
MATRLKKEVRRETQRTLVTKKGRLCKDYEVGRPLVVSLNPEETISFRVKGTRKVYSAHIQNVFSLALMITTQNEYLDKLALYNQKKKAGYRHIKKPRQPKFFTCREVREAAR